MRIAAFTMVYNEPFFLRLWAAHYGREVGAENLYCLDHGSTDGSTAGVVANTIRLPRGEFAEVPRARCVSHFQASLLAYYDAVIFSDADELLVADPARHPGLASLIAASRQPTLRAIGCDIVQVTGTEGPLDPTRPVLAQRGFARFNPRYCKPLISRVPLDWRPGFHHCPQPAAIDPDLYLLHLKYADVALFEATQAKRQSVTWAEEAVASRHGGHWRVAPRGIVARAFPATVAADAPLLGEDAFRALVADRDAARDPARLAAPFRIPPRFTACIPAIPDAGPGLAVVAATPAAPGDAEGQAAQAAPAPADQPERNRALLRGFLARRIAFDAEPVIERHAEAIVLPALRANALADPALAAEYGLEAATRIVDGGAYTAEGAIIPEGLHRAGGRVHMPRPDLERGLMDQGAPRRAPFRRSGRWILGGSLHHHFGHFMMESLGRLWAMESLDGWAEGIVWTLAAPRAEGNARFAATLLQLPFVRDTLRLLGLGALRHEVVLRPTAFEHLAVPSVLMLNGPPDVAAGHPAFRRFIRRLGEAPGGPQAGSLPGLYVSRAGLVAPARFAGEELLEQAFARAGWQVMRPEAMSVPDQIALYRAARRLVFAEGSALHLYAYVARPEQRVGILLRRLPAKAKFAEQLRGFGVTEVHVADAIAGIGLPDDATIVRGRGAGARHGATVLDYRVLGDWLVERGFLSTAERADAWAALDALPLPAEAPDGVATGPFMVPRQRSMPR